MVVIPVMDQKLYNTGQAHERSDRAFAELPLTMAPDSSIENEQLIQHALSMGGQTRLLRIQRGERHRVAAAVNQLFDSQAVLIIADVNTFAAAGRDVFDGLRLAGYQCLEPFVFEQSDLHAEFEHVEALKRCLAAHQDAVPVAVGSGTLNDLTKLASDQLQRPYLVVATAASMDGYSSFGASITRDGFKQTIDCTAPVGILADVDVLETAPQGMNASGYADLLAKSVAGADWLVADALAVEPIDRTAWKMMHSRFADWVGNPGGIQQGDSRAIHSLMLGLTMSGLAMQWTKTSRPASGADHQFSHLWDIQRHTYQGATPSHGFKVGIGTLASAALYEQLLAEPLDELDVENAVSHWPDLTTVRADIDQRFDAPVLADKAFLETQFKYVSPQQLREQLTRLRRVWPQLRQRLQSHLIPFDQLRQYLEAAGCPASPMEIGVSYARLRQNYWDAYYIRRRFTVLDLAARTGLLNRSLDQIFAASGRWG